MKKVVLIISCLWSFQINAQSFELAEKTTIDLSPEITIRDAIYSNEQVIAVGQIRNEGDIDSYLAIFDKEGVKLKSFSLPNNDSFSQFVKLIDSGNGYYLLENNSKNNNSIVKLYHYNYNLEKTTDCIIVEKQFNVSQDLCFLDSDNLLIAVWNGFNSRKSFPVIYKLDLASLEKEYINLDKKNSVSERSISPNASWTQDQKDSFKELADYEKIKVVKQVNKILVAGNDVYILGSESSDNISDYWICKLDNKLNVEWEKIYEEGSSFGADWLLNGFLRNNKICLLGYRYFKGRQGYDFNYLMVDSEGEIIINNNYDFGNHEIVSGMLNFDSLFIQYGIEVKTLDNKGYGELKKEMLILMIDEDGTVLHKKTKEFHGLDRIVKGLKINPTSFLLVGEEELNGENNHFFQKGFLLEKNIKP